MTKDQIDAYKARHESRVLNPTAHVVELGANVVIPGLGVYMLTVNPVDDHPYLEKVVVRGTD